MHTSVFADEIISALEVKKGGRYIDATYGQGGHTKRIKELGGEVLAIDADPEQVKKSGGEAVCDNFRDISSIAAKHGYTQVDGVLFDLGLSMEQLLASKRGFSYKKYDEPLDMRIGTDAVPASEILRVMSREEMIESLVKYSEDRAGEEIARLIYSSRRLKPLQTVGDLITLIDEALNRQGSHDKTNKTYARIFQAVRIIVNDEMNALRDGLQGSLALIRPGGHIAVITFHSLEDRLVKLFGRSHEAELTQKRITVGRQRELHSFERSAELRVFTKK